MPESQVDGLRHLCLESYILGNVHDWPLEHSEYLSYVLLSLRGSVLGKVGPQAYPFQGAYF